MNQSDHIPTMHFESKDSSARSSIGNPAADRWTPGLHAQAGMSPVIVLALGIVSFCNENVSTYYRSDPEEYGHAAMVGVWLFYTAARRRFACGNIMRKFRMNVLARRLVGMPVCAAVILFGACWSP